MHAANEALSIHPREFIFFPYWGAGGARTGFLNFCLHIMFPGSEHININRSMNNHTNTSSAISLNAVHDELKSV
jgi:hypothetical protein